MEQEETEKEKKNKVRLLTWYKTEQEMFFFYWNIAVFTFAAEDNVFIVAWNHFLKGRTREMFVFKKQSSVFQAFKFRLLKTVQYQN